MPGVPLLPLAIQFGAGIIFNTQDNEVGEKIKNGRCLLPKAYNSYISYNSYKSKTLDVRR